MTTVFTRMIFGFFLVSLLGLSPANAQILGLEGPITRVLPGSNQIVVMGARVTVPPGTPITTPTTNLTDLAGAANPLTLLVGDPLPGRGTTPGFIGGTAIINGRVGATGTMTATDVFVEPAENVMIGAITEAVCTNARCAGAGNILRLNGAKMAPIRDPRLAAEPIHNQFGFEVNLTGANLVGSAAESEGYFAGGRFNYFLLAITGAPLANPNQREVSILRAQCRDDAGGIQLDVLGAVHTPARGVVAISDANDGTVFGTQNTIAAGGRFGSYTFRLRNDPAFNTCPTSVTAQVGTASATAEVSIIP